MNFGGGARRNIDSIRRIGEIESMTTESTPTQGKPRVVDVQTWRAALADQRRREKGRGVEQLSHTFPLIDILP